MFGVDSTELLIIALVALVVIGPKDLPRTLRYVGNWVGKARRVASQFRASFDDMVRESELQELEQKWKLENERIIQEFPSDTISDRQYDSLPPPETSDDNTVKAKDPAPKAKKTKPRATKKSKSETAS